MTQQRPEAGIVPGLPNLHSHAFQRAMAGLTERRGLEADSFWTWREQMYRFVERLTPDDLEAIAAFAYMEMLEAGFTWVAEFHYLHHQPDGRQYANIAEMSERIVAAAADIGVGLTLLPVLYRQGGFGASSTTTGASSTLPTPANAHASPSRRPSSDSARSPRPISATACSMCPTSSPKVPCSASTHVHGVHKSPRACGLLKLKQSSVLAQESTNPPIPSL